MTKQVRKPRNIDYDASAKLESRVSLLGIPVPPNWQIYVTKSNKGYARPDSKTVTAPAWSYYHTITKTNDDPNHVIHYIAHELAHAWLSHEGDDISIHNKAFYAKYKELCPPHLWHYELEYKPRNAKVSGIDPNPEVNKGLKYGFEQARIAVAAGPGPAVTVIISDELKDHLDILRASDWTEDQLKSYARGWNQLNK